MTSTEPIADEDFETYLRDQAEELAGPDAAFLFTYVDWDRYLRIARADYRQSTDANGAVHWTRL